MRQPSPQKPPSPPNTSALPSSRRQHPPLSSTVLYSLFINLMNLDLGFRMHEGTPTLRFHPHHLVTATLVVCPLGSLELKSESKTCFTSVAPGTTATALGHATFTRVSVDASGPSLTREQPAPGGGGGGEARAWPRGSRAWM